VQKIRNFSGVSILGFFCFRVLATMLACLVCCSSFTLVPMAALAQAVVDKVLGEARAKMKEVEQYQPATGELADFIAWRVHEGSA
jgi:hypothetical protein